MPKSKTNNVVVYKVDRPTRSLTDFAKLVELFDQMRGQPAELSRRDHLPPRLKRIRTAWAS
jgi:hypothetical protein